MSGGAWWAAVHGVTKSRTRLSDFNFTFTFHLHALEKAMAAHSSVLAWRIPGTREPGGLLSMGSHRVRHDWSDLAAAAALCVRHFLELEIYQCFQESNSTLGEFSVLLSFFKENHRQHSMLLLPQNQGGQPLYVWMYKAVKDEGCGVRN